MAVWIFFSGILVLFANPDVSSALKASRSFSVSLSGEYGEGSDAFVARDRHQTDVYNCLTWLYWVLATAYAKTDVEEFRRYLDDLRYYDQISFAERKHFVDRWLVYDPAPLKPLEQVACRADQTTMVHLQLQRFRQTKNYQCSLYQEDQTGQETLMIPYLSLVQSHQCVEALVDGYYVAFFVPSEEWLVRWSTIGDFGTVHAMIIEKSGDAVLVHHASIDKRQVIEESWSEFTTRLATVAKGYRIFDLDDNWTVPQPLPLGSEECR